MVSLHKMQDSSLGCPTQGFLCIRDWAGHSWQLSALHEMYNYTRGCIAACEGCQLTAPVWILRCC